jgi:gluconate kinase
LSLDAHVRRVKYSGIHPSEVIRRIESGDWTEDQRLDWIEFVNSGQGTDYEGVICAALQWRRRRKKIEGDE